ncbi:hypothetical protein like AT5G40460 [Hibiscus trionum]|uniref:Cyclin-dependent protein kinase inhibitor SMR6 n=1 Tax=Hibiscus trionum TaxID=183268 RepID=A0A9W7J080_HIBTR|nr:hypothetical protein like AT5G40460 [Hibiscus trionum]
MGFSKKPQLDGVLDSEGKKWVIAGIAILTSLKPINTKPRAKENEEHEEHEEEESCSTTPTSKEARIAEKLACPLAPRKRRPTLRCHYNGVREFFTTPPDLESVFKLHVVE